MGYNTSVRGSIRIEPPLPWARIRDSEFLPERADERNLCIKFDVRVEDVETDDGTLTRRTAVAVVPIWEDPFKAYDIEDEIQRLVTWAGPDHEFVGRFDCEGEEATDLWRLHVVNGQAVRVEPRIVWPDES